MNRSPMIAVGLVSGLLAAEFTGCASHANTPAPVTAPVQTSPKEETAPSPRGHTWVLMELEGHAVIVPDERSRPSLLLAAQDTRASGMAGVNRFSGVYSLTGDTLKLGPLMATKMAGPPELNELEVRYLRMLEQANRWRFQGDGLELLVGERVVAIFARRG